MSVELLERQYRVKLKNGTDYLSNSTDFVFDVNASVMEEVQCISKVRVSRNVIISDWTFIDIGSDQWELKTTSNLLNAHANIGDIIFIKAFDSSYTIQATIVSIEQNRFVVDTVSPTTGGWLGVINDTDVIFVFFGNQYLYYSSEVIPDSDTPAFDNIFISDVINATEQTLTSSGVNKSWVTGDVKVRRVGFADTNIVVNDEIVNQFNASIIYEITETFIIPYYSDDINEDLDLGRLPEYLRGDNTLKHCQQFDFRSYSNKSTSEALEIESVGQISGFDETKNGLDLPYVVQNIRFFDEDLNEIEKLTSGETLVSVAIESLDRDFTSSDALVLYFSELRTAEEAEESTSSYKTLWKYDSLRGFGDTIVRESTIIKEFVGAVGSEILSFSFKIINNADLDTPYILALGIGDATKTTEEDKKGVILLQKDTYLKNTDIEGLFEVTEFNFYNYLNDIEEAGFSNYEGCIKDDVYVTGKFWILEDSILENFNISYVATNGVISKKISGLDFNVFSDVVDGIQQINLSQTLGYDVPSDHLDIRELKFLEKIDDKIYYTFKANVKLSHQDWLRANELIDSFYNNSLLVNGQSKNLNRYNGVNGYEIKLGIYADILYTDITTTYETLSRALVIKDYEEEVFTTGLTAPLCEIKYYRLDGFELPTDVITNETVNIHSRFKVSELDADLYDVVTYTESGTGTNNDLRYLRILDKYIDGDDVVFVHQSSNFNIISSRLIKLQESEVEESRDYHERDYLTSRDYI